MSRQDSQHWSTAKPYPNRTPHKFGSRTSAEAARQFEPKRNSLEEIVLSLLTVAGTQGLTDEELQARVAREGIRSLMRPRRATLTARGDIVDSGMTRPGASGRQMTVWRLAQ